MHSLIHRAAVAAAVAALSVAPSAHAQTTGGGNAPAAAGAPAGSTASTTRGADSRIDRGDRKFVEKAAAGGMFEVEAGKLAASKAQDPQVKAFGQMLVDHHGKANQELASIAGGKGVTPPAELPRAERRMLEKLGKKEAAEFDRDFTRDVGIKAHEKDIKLFEKQSKDGKDADLKAFAAKTLPVLRSHLDAARKLPGAQQR